MKRLLLSLILLCPAAACYSQHITGYEWNDPAVPRTGSHNPRTEIISWDVREDAEKGDLAKNPYHTVLDLIPTGVPTRVEARVDIPYRMLDRDIFLRVTGIPAFYVGINGNWIAYGEDSRLFSEFNISPYLADGNNIIQIETMADPTGREMEQSTVPGSQPAAYLMSQPKLRIDDYFVNAMPDSTWSHGVLDLGIIVSNSYNSPEVVTIGYDIYSPEGKLQYYDMTEVTVPANGTDTVRFNEFIYGADKHWWGPDRASVYYGMLTVRRDGRMTEYIPYRTAFGVTELRDGVVYRNNDPVEFRTFAYNSQGDRQADRARLADIRKAGYNTIMPDYPQPSWFYDLCAVTGLYVVDRANVNSDRKDGNRDIDGAITNDPLWLNSFLDRVNRTYYAARNYPAVIVQSLGGDCGNGYNMYKSYQMLKELDPARPVFYGDAQGEWNSDIDLPRPVRE